MSPQTFNPHRRNYMSNNLLPSTGFVRLSTILKIIPVSKSTWWLGVKTGRFPKSLKLSPNVTVWKVEDITQLISNNNNIKYNKE
jgi:prophage regulatory protein